MASNAFCVSFKVNRIPSPEADPLSEVYILAAVIQDKD
jgi:hypothetical protein